MKVGRMYEFKQAPTGEVYEDLLRTAAVFASLFGFIVRSPLVRLQASGRDVMESLAGFLQREEEVDTWPGTHLIGSRTSTRYVYSLTPASLDILLRASSSLYSWVNPGLPEDLHFLRQDGSTALGSVAQEKGVWLELTDAERSKWSDIAPARIVDSLLEPEG
jgi:hypothetical protein